MEKKVRKAVRTFLIQNNKVLAIQYKRKIDKDYYDIPGGKIEENETSEQASIREFKEETGMQITKQKKIGNVIVEYPHRIFDFDIYIATEYTGIPLEFQENTSMWIEIETLLKEEKVFPSIEILKHILKNKDTIKLTINCDNNHIITKVLET